MLAAQSTEGCDSDVSSLPKASLLMSTEDLREKDHQPHTNSSRREKKSEDFPANSPKPASP